jgi:hypothetical protein
MTDDHSRPRPTHPSRGIWLASLLALLLMSGAQVNAAPNVGDVAIYTDALADGWSNWSWDSTIDTASTTIIHAGTAAIAVTHNAGYAGFSVRTATPIATNNYTAVAFWLYGNGASLDFYTQSNDEGGAGTLYTITPAAGQWTEFVVPLSSLGSPMQIARVTIQSKSNTAQATYYVDDIRLAGINEPPPPNETEIKLNVDSMMARKPISPSIYGMNEYGSEDDAVTLMQELKLPIRRWGGNITTRYNWQTDVANHAVDWYFNNLKQSNATNLPDDSAVNRFIDQNRQASADSFLVLPMIGYVSNANATACSFSVTKYGPQTETAAADGRPDCGNGIQLDGSFIAGNDPLDTSIATDSTFIADWVSYLVGRYGRADAGGIRFYNFDNEPDLWFETHRDVRPVGYTYDEIRDLTYAYGAAIKTADPSAALLGPVAHGWTYYWHSPYDGQREDWNTPDDRNAHGGTPFVAWYLQQMRAYEEANDLRILDYLDLHYYPQANNVSLTTAGDAATQAKRLRTTRSLWDPTYVDESWIAGAGPEGGIVKLIPRMRQWVAENYPGIKLAIGEYNWGGLEHINGALAQAEVLGIFGREGVDLATLWQPPQLNQPGAFAFRIYRNYDGEGGQFGDTSVAATSSNQARLSIHAAQRTRDDSLTLVIINKSTELLSAELTLANFNASPSAQLYRYSDANLAAITHAPDLAITSGKITTTYPANSITLLVIPKSGPAPDPDPDPDPDPQPTSWMHLPMLAR